MAPISRLVLDKIRQRKGVYVDLEVDSRLEQVWRQGGDPLHLLYVAAQNVLSFFAEAVASEFDEVEDYRDQVGWAQDEYHPDGPPISPLTGSYFTLWAFLDVPLGPDGETMGSCMLEVVRALGIDSPMVRALDHLQATRMGIYQHLGHRGPHVRLRELVTGDEFVCHSSSGYAGRPDELWYVRLCPPISPADYHVAMTTPYVLIHMSANDWTAYLNKSLFDHQDKREGLHRLFKYGGGAMPWHEFIFEAYHHHQFDAIFLAGLPDVPASRPHSELGVL